MSLKARVNTTRLTQKFRRLPARATAPARTAIRKGGLKIRRTATVSIRSPGKGQLYTHRFFTDQAGNVRPLTGKAGQRPPHRASAPGDPPASDSGTLLGSVEMVLFDGGLAAEVGTRLDYGKFLEFGTSKMEARPWLGPAWDRHRKEIVRDVAREMIRVFKQFGRRR